MAVRATQKLIANWLYQAAPQETGWVPSVAAPVINTDREKIELYGQGSPHPLKEWLGPRTADRVYDDAQEMRIRIFQWAVHLSKREEKFGEQDRFKGRVQDGWRQVYPVHWEQLVTDMLANGHSSTLGIGADGQPFFSATHVTRNSGTQTNLVSQAAATGTAPTAAEAADGVWAALEQLSALKNDQGEPYPNDGPIVIITPTKFLKAFSMAVSADLLPNLGDSPLKQAIVQRTITVAENRRLPTASGQAFENSAVVAVASGQLFARAEALPFDITEEDQTHRNMSREYGVIVYRGIQYGTWQHAIKLTFT
jgi:hypothetical protein